REQLPDPVVPLGLLYVMEAVDGSHDKRLVDLCFEEEPLATLDARLREQQPQLVAIGLRNIQNNDYAGIQDNLAYYGALIRQVRSSTQAKIVIGGSAFSVMPEKLMALLRPDFGIWGEGEGPLPALIRALEAGGEGIEAIPNLFRMQGETPLAASIQPAFVDMDAAPIPSRAALDARYYQLSGTESVQTKRGCNLRCDYCTYPLVEGRVTRRRAPRLVVDELLSLHRERPDTRHVFIVDSVFNLPPMHAKAVCEEMIARGPAIPWTCYVNPLRFDDELASLMVRAGCAGIEIGSDSGLDEVLLRLRKGFDVAAIRRAHEIAARAGLKDCHSFILGTPGESLEDVQRTIDFIVELDPFAVVIGVWVDEHEALDPSLRKERRKLRDAINERLRGEHDRYPRWVIPSAGINFDPRLFSLLRRAGLHGPLWQHIDALPTRRRRRRPFAPATAIERDQ
ncbi:MAG: radical SAM protein, partial [Myxococcales bacterium]|nr:radical SAM protein [Myxococcales bacterium]